ncbi:MAG: ferredoxin reductase [Jiangellaceae bacterium]|nr:ferredoxin reductase [Jiangellaceae bacterium]
MGSPSEVRARPATSSWRVATVVRVRSLNARARSILLDVPGWPGHDAGQHVDVRLTAPDGYTAVRSYSIASATGGQQVELAVEELPNGEVSPYLTRELIVGDRIEVRGPVGGWFVWRPEQREPIQLLAGGSGVVPLVAIARSRSAALSAAPMQLLYSVRDPDSLLFGPELADLSAGDSLRVTYAYTRYAPAGYGRPPGRVDAKLIAAETLPVDSAPTCYVCGPTGFVETVATLLTDVGHDPARIRTERFGPTGGQR